MNDALNAVRIKPQITRKVIWRLAPLLILLYVVNQMDRANVGYAALTMNRELGMSVSQFGFAAGLFYAGYILVAVPSNLMLARFGARIWMTRILVTWGIVSVADRVRRQRAHVVRTALSSRRRRVRLFSGNGAVCHVLAAPAGTGVADVAAVSLDPAVEHARRADFDLRDGACPPLRMVRLALDVLH